MHSISIEFFGNRESGKTKLLEQLSGDNTYTSDYIPTTEESKVFFYNFIEKLSSIARRVKLSCCDDIETIFGAKINPQVYVYCVDLSKPFDRNNINQEIELFKKEHSGTPLILVGTKSDECGVENILEQLTQIQQLHGFSNALTTSAKKNVGILELKNMIADTVNNQMVHLNLLDIRNTLNPESGLYFGLTLLDQECKKLSPAIYRLIVLEAEKLIRCLNTDSIHRSYAINEFVKTCNALTEEKEINAIGAFVLGSAVGFTIGFIAAILTGPGALIIGYLIGWAIMSIVIGLAIGFLENTPSAEPQINSVQTVATFARIWLGKSEQTETLTSSVNLILNELIYSKKEQQEKGLISEYDSESLKLALDIQGESEHGRPFIEIIQKEEYAQRIKNFNLFFSPEGKKLLCQAATIKVEPLLKF